MKVLLIYPNTIESPKEISMGLASVSASLKQDGHEVSLFDTTFGNRKDEDIIRHITHVKPEFVCISIATNDFKYSLHILSVIKKQFPDVNVLAGGYHPTTAPEETLKQKDIDMICVGEGDLPIKDVANMLDNGQLKTDIQNIWFKKDGKSISNTQRQLPNLDDLPIPDYSIFDMQKYIDWKGGVMPVISTRGCPFPCTYCINRKQKEIYKGSGQFVRYKSVDKLLSEFKTLVDNYKLKEILFNDDTFTLDPRRIDEFCEKYPKVIGKIPFTINGRINTVTKDMLMKLGKVGCLRINYGVECGNEYIRNTILERNMTEKQMIDTFKWTREAGIESYSFNIIGIPYETKPMLWETVELNRKLNPDFVGVTIFTALPGTPLYTLCKEKGWLREEYGSSYFQDTNVIHPHFTVKELKKFRDRFGFEVFRKTKPMRAYVDLVDKRFTKYNSYMWLRSKMIKMGVKKILGKIDSQNFFEKH